MRGLAATLALRWVDFSGGGEKTGRSIRPKKFDGSGAHVTIGHSGDEFDRLLRPRCVLLPSDVLGFLFVAHPRLSLSSGAEHSSAARKN